jgi:nucleoside-diphosphate-sugar epimerase
MQNEDVIVVGATGLIGTSVCQFLKNKGYTPIEIHSKNYENYVGSQARVLINCNGSSYRYRSKQNPKLDFDANVQSVKNTLFDFDYELYVYCSTVDVYPHTDSYSKTEESTQLNSSVLHPYGFHKWLAERLVEKFAENFLILRLGTIIGPNLKKGPIFDILNGEYLHLSPQSVLSFIHTEWINNVIEKLINNSSQQEIYNVTGFGEVVLETLLQKFERQLKLHETNLSSKYSINIDKLAQVIQLPSSEEMVEIFIQQLNQNQNSQS